MFRRAKKIFLLLLVALLGIQVTTFSQPNSQPYKFTHISIQDGLSQSTVRSIIQDNRGLMWFGTEDGLNRYNGYEFDIYKPIPKDPSSINSTNIYSIFEDKQGILWIGTRGGLHRFHRDTETFTHYPQPQEGLKKQRESTVLAICQDRDGYIWFATDSRGLYKFNKGTKEFVVFKNVSGNPGSLSSNVIKSIYFDNEGILWVGTVNGLNRYDAPNKRFTIYKHDADNKSSISNNEINSIANGPLGHLWIGTADGLNRFNHRQNNFTRFKHEDMNPLSISSNVVKIIYKTPDGKLLIGTEKGLNNFNLNEETFTRFVNDPNDSTSLSSNIVFTIFQSQFQVLWIGSDGGGVSSYAPGRHKFRKYQNNPRLKGTGLSGKLVFSLFEDQNNDLWIGTSEGLNKLDRKTENFSVFRHRNGDPKSLSEDYVFAIREDSKKRLWVGTWGGGLNLMNRKNNTFKHYRHNPKDPNSLSDNIIRYIYEDKNGAIWIATFKGGVCRYEPDSDSFTRFKNIPGNSNSLSDNETSMLCEDNSGGLWIGTNNGLNRYDREKNEFTHYTESEGENSLSNDSIFSLYTDQSGILWIGTFGGGLNKFDPVTQKFTAYREKDGLPNDAIYAILEDDYHNLWLSTNYGLCCFNPEKETYKNYYARDGLQSNEFNQTSFIKTREGELGFGGIDGFNLFRPGDIQKNMHIPKVIFTEFKLFNDPVAIGPDSPLKKSITEAKEIRLTHEDYVFTIEFAALDYFYPEANQYAYMLEGLDKNWIKSKNQRFASYTTLNPGKYTFRVKGSNNDGEWNPEGTSIKIIVLPPYWQALWFRVLISVMLVLFVLAVFRIRTHNIRKRNTRLEEINRALNREIYDRKLAEENLTRSERRLRAFLQTASEGFMEADNRGFIQDVNPEMCAILGRKRAEIVEFSIFDFLDADGVNTMKHHMSLRIKGERSTYELKFIRLDNTPVYCLVNGAPIHDESKNIKGSFALITDISNIIEAEEELKRTKNYLSDVFDSLYSILISTDRHSTITQWNRAAEKFTGIVEAQAVSRKVWDVAPFLEPYKKHLEEVFKFRRPVELLREVLVRDNQEKKFIDIFIYPLIYSGVEGVVIQVDDVTESEKKDQQLIQAQKMEIVGNLAGGLAHDFNNVLGGIVGTTSLLKFLLESGEEMDVESIVSRVDTIELASERAVDLVRQLLTLSRKNEPTFKPLDINLALKHVIKICRNTFDKSINLDIHYPDTRAMIMADTTQFEQVLLNLCINASHAMTFMRPKQEPQGGTLTILVSTVIPDRNYRLKNPEAIEECYWVLEVADTGIGMDGHTMDKIFDPFFTTKSEKKGTGLGLSMVYHIIQQHKGFIKLDSEPGQGTSFKVFLPRLEEELQSADMVKKTETLTRGTGVILVVDDEQSLRDTSREILKSCGYDVLLAEDGIQGVRMYSEKYNEIDAVLLDMAMPNMSGKEVFLELKKVNPEAKVLLTSGFRQDRRVSDVVEMGVNGFLQKPYSLTTLSKKMSEILIS